MRHGTGDMVWNDGSTYEGEWSRGLPNGKGAFLFIQVFTRQRDKNPNTVFLKITY
jgi:hypothetical protein